MSTWQSLAALESLVPVDAWALLGTTLPLHRPVHWHQTDGFHSELASLEISGKVLTTASSLVEQRREETEAQPQGLPCLWQCAWCALGKTWLPRRPAERNWQDCNWNVVQTQLG